MPVQNVRTVIAYAEVREVNPSEWMDTGLSLRTPVSSKARLFVRRIDGTLQKWSLSTGATYNLAGIGLMIRGDVYTPIPAM